MDPVSSSPTIEVEFGLLPRTPASGLSKSGRTPNGKENSGGSLHKRFLNTLRGRSRSPKHNSEDGSPTAKPVRLRKSIVDLLNLSSRVSHEEKHIRSPAVSPSKDENTDKDYSNLFSEMPKRRRSLGNLLNPTSILGTVTNRVSQKLVTAREPINKENILIIRAARNLEHSQSKDSEENVAVHVEEVPKPNHHGKGPLHLKLAEGSEADIDLFESRLSRILDGIVEDTKVTDTVRSNNSYYQLLQEACDKVSDEDENNEDGEFDSHSQDSLRPVLSRSHNARKTDSETCTPVPSNMSMDKLEFELEEEKPPRTPDSYLQLLIASAGEPIQVDQPRSSNVSISEGSIFSYYQEPNDEIIDAGQQQQSCGEVEPSSMLPCTIPYLHAHQYEVRKITPNPMDKELSRRNLLDSRPTLTVREVSATSTRLDLDPDFYQRQAERAARYTGLGLAYRPGWKHDLEEIDRSIVLTVAKMTRNYHSTTDEPSAETQEKATARHEDEVAFNIRCCGSRFEFDQDEAWDSVITGRGLMLPLQDESCEKRCITKSWNATLRTKPSVQISLLDFDDLCTLTGSSISERDPFSSASLEDPTIPSIEEILLDSFAIRSPLDPFYANWKYGTLDLPLDLGQEIDYCPEYERFLRRTRGVIDPTPSLILGHETWSHSRFEGVMALPRIEKSSDIGSDTVQVRYPGTVNLFRHTECFSSMEDAVRGLCEYKLGDLATFFVYDKENRTIDAHPIESPVPNPAELKKHGLQLCWISRMSNLTEEDALDDVSTTGGSLHPSQGQSIRYNSAREELLFEMNFKDQPIPSQHDQHKRPKFPFNSLVRTASDGTPSVFGDDFFLADQSGSDLLGEAPISDYSELGALRAVVNEEDILLDLDFEDKVPPSKTWVDLAREQKALSLLQNQSVDENAETYVWNDGSLATSSFEDPAVGTSKAQTQSFLTNKLVLDIVDGYDIEENDDAFDSSDSSLFSKSSSEDLGIEFKNKTHSDELHSSADVRLPNSFSSLHTFQATTTPHLRRNIPSHETLQFSEQKGVDQEYEPRQNSVTPEPARGHSPGYYFTVVREHMMSESSEDAGRSFDVIEEHNTKSIDHAGIDGDFSLYDQEAAAIHLEATAEANSAEDKWNDLLQGDNLAHVNSLHKSVLGEMDPNDSKYPLVEFTAKSNTSYSAIKDLEQALVPEGEVTLMQLNLRPVGRAARSSPPAKKGKSKVGALVNIFQDYGLMPDKSRGTLPMPSISTSFSPRASRYRGEPSGTSVDSGTVREISETLSTGSLSVPSPINRAGSPYSMFERSLSRLSDVDTEESFQFGEMLKRTAKHGECENEDQSAREQELYG